MPHSLIVSLLPKFTGCFILKIDQILLASCQRDLLCADRRLLLAVSFKNRKKVNRCVFSVEHTRESCFWDASEKDCGASGGVWNTDYNGCDLLRQPHFICPGWNSGISLTYGSIRVHIYSTGLWLGPSQRSFYHWVTLQHREKPSKYSYLSI